MSGDTQDILSSSVNNSAVTSEMPVQPEVIGRYVGAFFDELIRLGVRDVVVSPGSRSTPLAMVAYEASRRFGAGFNLYLDVDERGAAFFALGRAKATGRAVCVVCTSGTAVANWCPAVMEAESSRVPLVVLSGDRPLRLQGLGAPQTFDQVKIFSDHVRRFIQVPEPRSGAALARHVRQLAREAFIAAAPGSHVAGPVHVNFYFDEPLIPAIEDEGLFSLGADPVADALPPLVVPDAYLTPVDARRIAGYLDAHRVVVLAGEGTFSQAALADYARRDREVQALIAFAERFDAPLLADPLSQLRSYGHPAVICGFDRIIASGNIPDFDCVVRFGRYPVSKTTTKLIETHPVPQIVVDPLATRDFNYSTTSFVRADPLDFVVALLEAGFKEGSDGDLDVEAPLPEIVHAWGLLDRERAERIEASGLDDADDFEGAYVHALIDELPAESLLFTANSMSVRAVDAFYLKHAKRLTVLANRGLNGIDGTVSSALGAAQSFEQTVLLTGDLTLLHDLNALALQGEMALRERTGGVRPSVLVVLLNNNGGAIFDMLPQRSDNDYFERLFLTPQQVDFRQVAGAFGVPVQTVGSVAEFRAACRSSFGVSGISLIEVPVPLAGTRDRYNRYW